MCSSSFLLGHSNTIGFTLFIKCVIYSYDFSKLFLKELAK